MFVRAFLCLLLSLGLSSTTFAASLPDASQLRQQLEEVKSAKNATSQTDQIQSLEAALAALSERDDAVERAQQYQQVIDDFPRLARELRQQIASLNDSVKTVRSTMSSAELEQEILQISSQLIEEGRQAQQEQDRAREISDSLSQLPQQQTEARRALTESERRLQSAGSPATPAGQAQLMARQAENAANKARVDEFELAQLSANNRQELARMRAEVHQRKVTQLDNYLQALRNQLNEQRQREAETALARTEQLAENSGDLPPAISKQFHVNRELSGALNQQAQRMDLVASQQRLATNQIIQVRQALSTLREQSQWLGASSLLGDALRAQVARLPDMPKSQQIDNEMAQLRVQRLHYEDLLEQQNVLRKAHQPDGQPFTSEQKRILDAQLKTQRELLNSLISGCDTLILEITKLKVANTQLQDALTEVKDATHRYLFWTADVSPISLSYPLDVANGLSHLLTLDTLGQLGKALAMMFTSRSTVLPILGAVLLVGFSLSTRRHFNAFLERSASKVGKVTQDRFRLTIRTVFWSILVALPLPVLWATLGYGLQNAWPYPVAVAIGDGITATLPLLWIFMVSAQFARPNGLFIVHFRWPQVRVARAMRYYSLSIGLIVPLIMLLITFDNLDDRLFSATLGRLCFILICGALSIVTVSLKRAGIPLYLDKEGSGENMINRLLWNLMIAIPLVAALASMTGYLETAQALLARLETSVAIWFFLLVIYHIIRRWMLIQRRRLGFDRARQRRADMLANRARNEEEKDQAAQNTDVIEIEEPVIDLDAISAQSLRLVRSILTLIALVSVIVLWSEIHSAFGFLENIRLWDVNTSVQGVESIQPITLGAVLIAILVFVITTQLVRNMPALLELALLQHLDLSPGTGYAITTLTKYVLLLIGGLLGFSLIGIEWSKLQWLVTGLGVGLGFGLQEIFANFISGLIILFEKPIRIGDTVTIRDLTGSITRINTRATTITDWDRKEIIVPNKAFITEQFVNWSLSDSVTRVVLTIPAPATVSSEEVTTLLKQAAERCSYVLDTPPPEVFLVDLQQGIQLFELRVHAAEMGHRMPLRHELHQLILHGFAEHGIEMPFPPFQMRVEALSRKTPTGNSASTTRTFRSGGL
ncbi:MULTISPECIES: miniconductance mechanosensitive channel MscM [Pantoea]|uniref:Miniconductance mechanosensitive channel MscM n=1 Tax=Pantoea stewartii subsp. stewartii DC283 TaxID=660596 RepID=H3RHI5_PANSE|nr:MULTISPECIES: miniconductance mechanosensitive channel MscM [Pantoea]ARF51650.1 miniconductance mechanosensitive channel MscM [Pantoea stewartii subsp. stewartii DC283]EHT99156.1 putative mechanosensitive channel [Pantoea stewartii subsp. stewartii DC283]KAB0556520.1 miniconductance mechanosensitive channel MscM [Pantoea stewartii subsp. stewartii]KHE00712.1 mechanosensitive channel protein [Pantoea stewartii]KHN61005.1 mechanosensitive channel protein [Pantoea stewartii]